MPQLIEIGTENFPVYAKGILEIERASFPSPWSLNAFRVEAEKHISHLWVLVSDAVLSGYICFWVLEGEGQLLNLAVHPEKRGNRFGQFLLTKMIEKAVAHGATRIWLEVRPSNSAARGLYKKMGFLEAGIRPGYYSETKKIMIMLSRDLNYYSE